MSTRPGRLETVVAKFLTNRVLVHLRYASGREVLLSRDDYAELPMATVLGSEFLGFVEVGSR